MDLKQHKALLFNYEEALDELRALKAARPDIEWAACADVNYPRGNYRAKIPIPSDYVKTLLRERIWDLEKNAQEMARLLGLAYSEHA